MVALPIVASPTWTPVRAKLPACDGLQRSLPVRGTVTLVLVPAGWVTIVASTLALPADSTSAAPATIALPAAVALPGAAAVVRAAAAGVVDAAAPDAGDVDGAAASDEPNGPQPAVSSAAATTLGSRAARDSGRRSLIGPVSASAVHRGGSV